ncbi:methylated-DNA--[protein]-cysteine S-methyltransferase [Cocleimonas sp. KMM 6892]|uniref:bifunctional helix-turn-helix domain-containing protein/methylated-DNA--[protein]-cysteine S-methyltransferase n=1 Tax=unclassified Cocleimonas TaxID=2639732 RepID=UPI002DB8A230|nr:MULTISPECIES: methylated-DNA--[protein]-cysteine S-methyltransferase [unclassified Cocleimonas]MEB8432508.1 methylated-DNA--[protein]-cysteine S-methyltransferase [Cocleimonas sp. KMM 6892]MEC4715367.1 methylated-DNA--[protein]-cysteine S-methyltransferase [Cocleimonas sp. KMM 6895]MEC4745014.1 methylated-DNA--[protein]-cysteine S-methyltransferase [Cocleimonas sp. KMM 6896]
MSNIQQNTDSRDYERIETAILFIKENFQQQPSLDEIATHVHLSPFHFQRLFTDWAGISPKQFLQYTSINYAKQILKESQSTLLEVSEETGLSGTGRLHDLFIKIEGMTPGEYKKGGESLTIYYQYVQSVFGLVLVASTEKGICYMGFVAEEKRKTFEELLQRFPQATFKEAEKELHSHVVNFGKFDSYNSGPDSINKGMINLHIKGSEFQLNVWEALLKIPLGQLNTYGNVADIIKRPKASRAVGTAIGSNPVAFLIPCHRVIRASGVSGGYMWGQERKSAMLGWEAAQIANSKNDKT